MASPAAPGLLLCFAAMVLLVFVSVSAPTWDQISFLDVTAAGSTIHFGVFGYTGSGLSVGYSIDPVLWDLQNTKFSDSVIHSLTGILILHPIAAGLSGLAVLFGLCGAAYSREGTALMTISAMLAIIVTLLAWINDMVLWLNVRNYVHSGASQFQVVSGTTAQLGNAIWITLGALTALILAFCAGAFGSCGRYSRNERWRGKV